MSDQPPPNLPPRRKLDVEQPLGIGGMRQGAVVVYAIATLVLIGVAFYMAVVEQRSLTSAWVAAPAIGAAWFGLRTFMTMNSGK